MNSSLSQPVSPWVVAGLRGLAEAVLLAAIGYIITYVTAHDLGDLAPYSPGVLAVLRLLEGIVDTKIDPTKQRLSGGVAAD